jgi:hypothetical protein
MAKSRVKIMGPLSGKKRVKKMGMGSGKLRKKFWSKRRR